MRIKYLFKRLLKAISTLIGVALGLLVAYIGCKLAYAAIDKEDCFYVQEAQLLDPDYLRKPGNENDKQDYFEEHFGFSSHRLKPGRGIVLGYRFFSNGNVMTIDDETYRKITIWLPDGLPNARIDTTLGEGTNTIALLSSGGSAWPNGDCSGYVSTGKLHVEPRGKALFVSLHGVVSPKAKVDFRQCDQTTLDLEFEAKPLTFSKLTPWLGGAGSTHPYNETYRR